jgi:hypothetical protein
LGYFFDEATRTLDKLCKRLYNKVTLFQFWNRFNCHYNVEAAASGIQRIGTSDALKTAMYVIYRQVG